MVRIYPRLTRLVVEVEFGPIGMTREAASVLLDGFLSQ